MRDVHPSLVAILAALLIIPGLVFIGMRLALPGDASSPAVNFWEIRNDGLVVQPRSPSAQGLQDGDVVTAVQGRGVNQYLQDPLSDRESPGSADPVEYSLLRGATTLHLKVARSVPSLSTVLKDNWGIYFFLVYLELVSLFVFILRPRLAVVQLFFLISNLLLSSSLVYFTGLMADDLLNPWKVLIYLDGSVPLYVVELAALVHFVLIFPKRHPLLVRYPKGILLVYLGVWIPLLVFMAARWSAITSPAGRLALTLQGTNFTSAIIFPLLLLATYSSYRTSNQGEKRQYRWLMWSLSISLIPYLVFNVLPSLMGMNFRLANSLVGLLWCTIPTSFAIAILRERLFDVDVIIRRTLIYTVLSVVIGALYFASILLLQEIFQTITGQHQSTLATVLSTLMIAALFNPLRRRIQSGIDRRFYRRKYDADKLLIAFALSVRDEVEFERLTDHLLETVNETMEPQRLSLWIGKPIAPEGRKG